ncbi:helix-turn-helix domain-containing protein [Glutamicibacter sp. FBE19]|uniref:helix-turn-helix domain-containing protein n=1 Tax=Glutamicibacter sp. FBE19 TaxID=2761534 RepID=UPI00189666FE|nr:helix-turn-helix domain-containing protein [Glutamicibacter sp. FBE19]
MSIRALKWAFDQKLPTIPKFVLVVLGDYADERHSCFPGQKHIAETVGSSESSVRRALKTLEDEGLIIRERRTRENGSRTSDRYVLPVNVTDRDKGGLTGHSDTPQPVRVTGRGKPSEKEPKSAPDMGSDPVDNENPTGHSDTPISFLSQSTIPKNRFDESKPSKISPAQRVTTEAYEAVGKAFNYVAVMKLAEWMLRDRHLTEPQAVQAIVDTYRAGKPIIKTTLGQLIDGYNSKANVSLQSTSHRMQQTLLLAQELEQRNQGAITQ